MHKAFILLCLVAIAISYATMLGGKTPANVDDPDVVEAAMVCSVKFRLETFLLVI
jgi:hypothetical protein